MLRSSPGPGHFSDNDIPFRTCGYVPAVNPIPTRAETVADAEGSDPSRKSGGRRRGGLSPAAELPTVSATGAATSRSRHLSILAMGWASLGLAASAGWRPIERAFQGPTPRGWSAAAGGGDCGCGGSALPFGRKRIGAIGTGKNSRVGRWPVVNCGSSSRGTPGEGEESWVFSDDATPYQILGVDPSCSPSELKTAFRSRVPDLASLSSLSCSLLFARFSCHSHDW